MERELKERLRARKVRNSPAGARVCSTFVNPDGPEAADRIEALEAQLAIAKEASDDQTQHT